MLILKVKPITLTFNVDYLHFKLEIASKNWRDCFENSSMGCTKPPSLWWGFLIYLNLDFFFFFDFFLELIFFLVFLLPSLRIGLSSSKSIEVPKTISLPLKSIFLIFDVNSSAKSLSISKKLCYRLSSIFPISISLDLRALLIIEIISIGVALCFLPILIENPVIDFLFPLFFSDFLLLLDCSLLASL